MSNLPEQERISEIIRLHEEIVEALKSSLPKAIRIGELLTHKKRRLGHGKFLPWVEKHLPFTSRTATNYMKLYRQRNRLSKEGVEKLGQAYKLLSSPKPKITPAESKSETVSDLDCESPVEKTIKQLIKMGFPPDPTLIPGPGQRLIYRWLGRLLWIDPSNHPGYFYVTRIDKPPEEEEEREGVVAEGTRKPIPDFMIPFNVNQLGADFIVRFGERNEIGASTKMTEYNPWIGRGW
jgi:hypothetical protein